jgi:transmembrane sensor
LRDEALDWVIRLTSGMATTADAEALSRWRSQSPAHSEAFAEALRLRHALRHAGREFEDGCRQVMIAPRSRELRRHLVSRRAVMGGALAAAAAGWMIVRPPFALWPSFVELTADYRTGTGERRHLALVEGISLEMNTQTSIAVRSVESETQVELISGETEVSTRRDPAMPFVLIAAGGRSTAAQARFNIRQDQGTVCVTCIEGAVEVARLSGAVRLLPGQQVIYDERGLRPVVSTDTDQATAWRAGLLVFHDTPLAHVLDEVNRYRPGKIILTDQRLGRRPFNGIFHLDRLDGVIAQLQKLGVAVTSLPGGIVLLG